MHFTNRFHSESCLYVFPEILSLGTHDAYVFLKALSPGITSSFICLRTFIANVFSVYFGRNNCVCIFLEVLYL
jgi:hypothetical protein